MFGISKFFTFEKRKSVAGKGYVLLRMNHRHEIILNKLIRKTGVVFYNKEHHVALVVDPRNRVKHGSPRRDRHYARVVGAVVRNRMLCFELESQTMYRRHRSLLARGFRHYKPTKFELLLEMKPYTNKTDLDALRLLASKLSDYFPNGLLFDSELWGRV